MKPRKIPPTEGLVAVVWHDLFSSSYLFEKAASSILEFFLIRNIAKGGKIAIKSVKVLLLCSLVCSPCLGNMVPLERTQHASVVNVCCEDIGVADSKIDEKIDKNYGIRDATIRSIGMLIGMPLGVLLVVAAIEIPYYWKAWKKAQAWKERKRHGE